MTQAVLVEGDALVWGDADVGAPGPGEVLIANRLRELFTTGS